MSWYKKIPYWENRKRVKMLIKFRKLVVNYFNNVEYNSFFSLRKNQEAIKLRHEINLCLDKIYSYIISAGINPTIYYSPPPAIGGIAGDIDLIHNIFHLHRFEISPHCIIDNVDRAIGIYEDDKKNALFRTLNPFFWTGRVIDFIVEIPFKLIGEIGFNREKIESSLLGRVIKGILYLITVGAAFLTILEKLGYLNDFKSWIQRLIK